MQLFPQDVNDANNYPMLCCFLFYAVQRLRRLQKVSIQRDLKLPANPQPEFFERSIVDQLLKECKEGDPDGAYEYLSTMFEGWAVVIMVGRSFIA
jgi:hypothetical protein